MKKGVISFVIFSLLLTSFMGINSQKASADSLYIKKIVSIVYDDSGSMHENKKMIWDKWANASYATQSFCGMLNSEDKVSISYMSHFNKDANYVPEDLDLSSGGIQASVDSIKNHRDASNTPYGAVDAAVNKLKSQKDDKESTEYWLVVITDGKFNDIDDEKTLNDKLMAYTKEKMPNDSYLKITYLAIGTNVFMAKDDPKAGIYSYNSKEPKDIIGVMSQMADRVSGRTRLSKNDMNVIDSKTIKVSSKIPLLNIAVLSQNTKGKMIKATDGAGNEIAIARTANMGFEGYDTLNGSSYLLGDSKNPIDAGEYTFTFDNDVKSESIDVLFEPALETRMEVKVNGQTISDYSELNNITVGDKITIATKVYQMGTDTEVGKDVLPEGTTYKLTISEDGKLVAESKDGEDFINEYEVGSNTTTIGSAVTIEGFNPIEEEHIFTAQEKPAEIKISSEWTGNNKAIKYDDINGNKDVKVTFSFTEDGAPITDPNRIKEIGAAITVEPAGNDGDVEYTNDGKIIFTPNKCESQTSYSKLDVNVTCTAGAASETATYSVLMPAFAIVGSVTGEEIRVTEFYGNTIGAAYYVTKDGVKIPADELDNNITATLNDSYADGYAVDVKVASDGTVTCTPYSMTEHKLNFGTWWVNWIYYFGLPKNDVEVTFASSVGTDTQIIPVCGAPLKYLILCVWLPLILELLLLAAIIAYIVRYITKPKFGNNAVIYFGSVRYTEEAHSVAKGVKATQLKKYNTFANLWNPFKPLVAKVNGLEITACVGGKIIVGKAGKPWFGFAVEPLNDGISINSPEKLVVATKKDSVEIIEIKTSNPVKDIDKAIGPNPKTYYAYKAKFPSGGEEDEERLESAKFFCYAASKGKK